MARGVVLGFSEHYRPLGGGSATYTIRLSRALASAGWDVRLVTYSPLGEIPRGTWTHDHGVSLLNFPVSPPLPYDTRRSRWTFAARVRMALPRLLREHAPDIVHILYGHAISGILRMQRDIPSVWTVQNVPPREYGGLFGTHLAYGQRLTNRLYHAVASQIHQRRLRQSGASRIIAVSAETRRALLAASVADDRITVIPDGVDTLIFQPLEPARRSLERQALGLVGFPILVSVAGLAPHKGHMTVLRALEILRREFPDLLFVNIGSNRDPQFAKELHRLCVRLQLDRHCRFLPGTLSPHELSRFYHACDVYLQPSSEEGFGMAALEAISCGCPIVATDRGELGVMVRVCGAGPVIPVEDSAALADAVMLVLRDPDSEEDRQARHAFVAARYSWDVVAQQVIHLYETLQRERRRTREQHTVAPGIASDGSLRTPPALCGPVVP